MGKINRDQIRQGTGGSDRIGLGLGERVALGLRVLYVFLILAVMLLACGYIFFSSVKADGELSLLLRYYQTGSPGNCLYQAAAPDDTYMVEVYHTEDNTYHRLAAAYMSEGQWQDSGLNARFTFSVPDYQRHQIHVRILNTVTNEWHPIAQASGLGVDWPNARGYAWYTCAGLLEMTAIDNLPFKVRLPMVTK